MIKGYFIGLLKSKTFWLNFILLLLDILNDTAFSGIVPNEWKIPLIAFLNIIMRLITKKSILNK